MNKAKWVAGLIILGFFGLLIFQNQELFFQQQKLGIDLFVIEKIEIPQQYLAVFFLIFFLLGFFIAYGSSLYARWKSGQMIKSLNQKINSLGDIIAKFEMEKDVLGKKILEKSRQAVETTAAPLADEPVEVIQPDKSIKPDTPEM